MILNKKNSQKNDFIAVLELSKYSFVRLFLLLNFTFVAFFKNEGYRNNYSIKSIPRYILIEKDGKIINSNTNEPSISVEKEIESAVNR